MRLSATTALIAWSRASSHFSRLRGRVKDKAKGGNGSAGYRMLAVFWVHNLPDQSFSKSYLRLHSTS